MSLAYRMIDVDVCIDAPARVAEILRHSYRRFPTGDLRSGDHAVVTIKEDEAESYILVNRRPYKTIPLAAGGGALVVETANAIIGAVAERSKSVIFHAAALEREGNALLLAAPTFCGKTLLATHLVSRGWRIISDEYAFVDPESLRVEPFPKLVLLRWTSLPMVPRSYRRAIELSPWYNVADSQEIVFTAADPADGYSEDVWSTGGWFTHLLLFSGLRGPLATIDECDAWSAIPQTNALVWPPADFLEGLRRLAASLRRVTVAQLTPSTPLETAGVIDRWYLGRR